VGYRLLLNQRGQLDLRSQTFGSRSSSGKQRTVKEKLFVLSVLVAHGGQNDEVQIEDEGSLEWKRKKELDGRQQKHQMEGLGFSCVQQIPQGLHLYFFNKDNISILTYNLYSLGTD
jgi:hypothetical protein